MKRPILWFVLLIATAIAPMTTPVDEWTGWTIYSLVGALACVVGLIVALTWRKKPTAKW